jgi:hypothetical protein
VKATFDAHASGNELDPTEIVSASEYHPRGTSKRVPSGKEPDSGAKGVPVTVGAIVVTTVEPRVDGPSTVTVSVRTVSLLATRYPTSKPLAKITNPVATTARTRISGKLFEAKRQERSRSSGPFVRV